MVRRLVPTLICGTVLALAACSGSQGAAPRTPEGWTRVETGALSVAMPEGWVDIPQSDDLWSVGWATDTELVESSLLLVGAPDFGLDGAESAFDHFVAGASIGGWGYTSTGMSTPVETESLVVWRNDYAYEEVTGVFWSASDPRSGATVGLQLTGRDLPSDVVDGIQESIAVLPG